MSEKARAAECILTLLMVMGAGAVTTAEATMEESTQRDPGIIEPFQLQGVELLPGRLKDQFEQVKSFYLELRPNDMLRGFRARHGQWAPGKELGGAYSQSALTFGQWLSGFARMYRATGDAAAREKAVYLMDEWGKTIDEDGSFGYTSNAPGHYLYDKFVGGLVDVYQFIGDENALSYLDQITGWAEKNLDRSRPIASGGEWYTLSENLYRAYLLTGEQRYYDFAKVWEYPDYWDTFARKENVFHALAGADRHRSYHAYSHVNSLSGAAMAYRATGERRYLDTIVNAYAFLQDTQLYATGGYGPEENFVVPNGMPETLVGIRRGESNVDIRFHFETSCGSWAGFKLGRYLMRFTGEAFYGDWIERLVYNGVGAMVPMNEYGMIMYGSCYNIYGAQKSHSTVWFCCQGSLPQTVTDYHDLIYFKDPHNLYVNLYVPSRVEWAGPGGVVTLTQETQFPESDTVSLRIQSRNSSRFGLKFRVPLWAEQGIRVTLNNEEQDLTTEPGTWAVMDREWHDGDRVTLQFDLSIRGEPLPGYVSPVAILYGPVVMVSATAAESSGRLPTQGTMRFPADWLEVSDPVRLNPHRQLHTNQELRPFYDLQAGEFYRMYHNRSGRNAIPTGELRFQGPWVSKGIGRYAEEPESRFEGEFTGSAVVWEGLRHKDAGIAEVQIDGKTVAEVDQYGFTDVHVPRLDQREVPFRWSRSDLANGKHTITVTVTGRKNPASRGTEINVSGLSAYP